MARNGSLAGAVLDETRACDDAILEKRPNSFETVGESDFLTVRDAAGVVADRHFVNRVVQAAQLRRDFRAELEALAFELYLAQHGRPESLVRGGSVGKPGVEQKI